MCTKQIGFTGLAVVFLSFSAYAAQINFTKADKNGDDKLSKEEFSAAFAEANPTVPDRAGLWFDKIDLNHDGGITAEEFSTPRKPAVESGSAEEKAAGLSWECKPEPNLPNVLILGDSISIGYTLQVRDLLKGKANVYRPLRHGKPENCFTAENGITNFNNWAGTQKWSVIHFNFGLHDLKYVDGKTLDKVKGTKVATVDVYRKNLEMLLPIMQKTGAKLIFATTTTVPADEAGRVQGDETNYNAAAVAVMKKYGVAVDDLHALTAAFPPELFKKPANVHYSDEGSARLAKQVADSILKELAK